MFQRHRNGREKGILEGWLVAQFGLAQTARICGEFCFARSELEVNRQARVQKVDSALCNNQVIVPSWSFTITVSQMAERSHSTRCAE
ncbi:hypothetical protein VTO42DRAFT_5256 [Malbranchea cinnamomea]